MFGHVQTSIIMRDRTDRPQAETVRHATVCRRVHFSSVELSSQTLAAQESGWASDGKYECILVLGSVKLGSGRRDD